MNTPDKITPADLRNRLESLALKAACFVRGRGSDEQRKALMEEIKQANAALRADDAPNAVIDPETHIRQYIDAGGEWQPYVATINRMTYSVARKPK